MGTAASAGGQDSIAFGVAAGTQQRGAIAFGSGATSNGIGAQSIGLNASATGLSAMAIGGSIDGISNGATSVGNYATAIGGQALANKNNAMAIGSLSSATGANSMALGTSATATAAGGIALGDSSVANAGPVAGFDPITGKASTSTSPTWKATQGAVSVGGNGATRQITNVAAGSADTDVANIAQLKSFMATPLTFAGNSGSTAKVLGSTMTIQGAGTTAGTYTGANLKTNVDASGNLNITMTDAPVFTSATIGGNTKLDSTGLTITGGPSVTTAGIDGASKKITNVAAGSAGTDAVNVNQLTSATTNPLTFAGNIGSTTKQLGQTLTVQGAGTTAGTYTGANLKTNVDASGNLNITMTDAPVFTSTTIGGNTLINGTGLTITGGPSVTTAGINAASKKITNVANGTADSDAVNLSQLKSATVNAAHYYSVNDGGTTGANYNNDGALAVNGLAAGVGASVVAGADNGVAVGNAAASRNIGAIAIGNGAISGTAGTTSGAGLPDGSSVAIGSGAQALKLNSVAIGTQSDTGNGAANLAIGPYAKTIGQYSYSAAIGYGATASADSSVALGTNSVANTAAGVAGYDPTTGKASTNTGSTWVSTAGAVSVGGNGITRQITNVAAGAADTDAVNVAQLKSGIDSTKTHYYSVNDNGVQGGNYNNDGATGLNALAGGIGASASGTDSMAMGYLSNASADYSVALGTDSLAKGDSSMALGNSAVASTEDSIAVGQSAAAEGFSSVALGSNSSATGRVSVAVGSDSVASGDSALAFGQNAQSTGNYTLAMGASSLAGADSSLALGQNAQTTGEYSIVVGNGSRSTGYASTVVGNAAQAGNDFTVAVGSGANAGALGATVAGANAQAMGERSTALGADSLANGVESLALGQGAQAKNNSDVALGAGSVTDAAVGTAGATIAGTDYSFAGANPTSTVSVGSVGNERTVTNVAAGRLSATSTDAVNGSQLFATNSAIENINNTVNAGWNVEDANGNTANVGPNGKVTFSGDSNVTVTAGGAQDAGTVGVQLNKNLDLSSAGSLTIGNSRLDNSGLVITNGPSVTVAGIDAGSKKITNVQAGVADTDGVNVSQLKSGIDSAKTHYYSVNDNGVQGGNYNNDGATGANALAAGIGAVAAGNSAVAMGKNSYATTSASAIGESSSATGSTSVAIGQVAKSSGEQSIALGRMAKASGLASTAIGTGSDASGTWATAIGINNKASGVSSTALGSSSNAQGESSVAVGDSAQATGDYALALGFGSGANGSRSMALGSGSMTAADDSVALGSGANTLLNGGVAIGKGAVSNNANDVALGSDSVTDVAVGTAGTTIAGTDYSFAGANPTSTVSVGSVGNERTITNVAAGRLSAESTDAVNGSQLFASNQAIDNLNINVDNLDKGAVKYDTNPDGTVNYNSVTLAGGTEGTTISNLAAGVNDTDAVNVSQLNDLANTPITFAGNSGSVDKKLGDTFTIEGVGSTAGTYSGSNLKTEVDANGNLQLLMADAPKFGNVTINADGSGKITGLTAGTDATDAVNVSQLTSATENAVQYDDSTHTTVTLNQGGDSTTITNLAAGELSADSTDAVNGSQLYETNQNVTNLGDQVENIYNTGTKYFHANSTGADSVASGVDSVAIGMGAVASHDGSIALGAGSLADGSTLGSQAYLVGGTATGEVNIGDRRITGLSAGAEDTDAVNVAQLKAAAAGSVADAVMYDDPSHTSVTLNKGGDSTTITNVAAGVNDTDAVNVSQLNDSVDAAKTHYFSVNDNGVQGGNFNNDGATGLNALAAGVGAQASGARSTAIGENAVASDESSVAIAANANAAGMSAIAIGRGSAASADHGLALGTLAQANAVDSVALGAHSVASEAVGTSDVTINGTTYQFAGTKPLATVSVGTAGFERTLTNVAAGRLSAESTDAVNGSQLFASNQAIEVLDKGAVKYDTNPDGTVNYNSVTLAGDNGTTISNVAAGVNDTDAVNVSQLNDLADTPITFAGNSGSVGKKLGDTFTIEGVGSTAGSYSGNNLKTEVDANGNLQLLMADAPKFGDVTINADGSGKITGLTAGTDATDAVNVSQLTSATENAVQYDDSTHTTVTLNNGGDATTITNLAAGELSADSTDAVNGSQLYETNQNVTNLGDTVNNIYNTGTKYFHANSTGDDSQAIGQDAVAIGMGAVANNANDVALGAGSVTDAAVGTAGTTIAGTDYSFAGSNPASTVSVGSVDNERTITNVAAGRLSADSTDAVNGSQLFASNQAIDNLNINVDNLDKGAVKYDVNPDGTVNYDSVTLAGGENGTKITNVAAGELSADSTDAVNGSQLNETNQNVTNLGDTINNFAGDQTTEYTEINGRGIRYVRTNDTGLELSDSSAQGQGSTAVGYNATSIGESSLALGREAKANNAGDVALGAGSVTDAAVGTAGTTIAGTDYSFAGTDPLSTVSVGSVGKERTITNVAAGRLSADSTDAVNGSQLFASNQAIDNLNINVDNLDKGAVKYDVNPDGTVNYDSVTLAGGENGTKITNVAAGELSADSTDAVNGSQLFETNQNVTNLGDTINNFAGDQSTEYTEINGRGIRYVRTNDTGLALSDSSAQGQGSTAVGYNATSIGESSLALGREAKANNVGDVALGAGSTTDVAVGTAGVTLDHTYFAFAGANPTSTVSVGSVGHERTITNVAAGRISADSTDAINGSQLNATNVTLNNFAGDQGDAFTMANGRGIRYAATNDAGNELGDAFAQGYASTAMGYNALSSGESSLALGHDSVANNANDVALGAGSVTDAAVGTAGATIAGTDYSFAGANPTSTVSVGSVGNERTITNVAAGRLSETSTDAVNGSQLFATNSAIDSLNINIDNLDKGAVKYDVNPDGTVNYNSVTLGGDTYNSTTKTGGTKITNVARGVDDSDAVNMSQLNETNTNVTNLGDTINNFAGDQSTEYTEINGRGIRYVRTNDTGLAESDSSAQGQGSTAVGYNATSIGESSLALGREAKANNAGDVALGAGSVTDAAVGTAGATIAGTDYSFAGANPTSTVSVGSVGNERTITNVAAGRLSADSTDAVNGSQLFASNQAIDNINNSVNVLDKGAVKYDVNPDGTVNYDSVTLAGGDNGTRITNVAAGELSADSTDAVNGSQLFETNQNVTNLGDTINNFAGDQTTEYTEINGRGIRYVRTNDTGLAESDSSAQGQGSSAVGYNATSVGDSSLALGREALAWGDGSVATGESAVAAGHYSTALGAYSAALNNGDVALGAGSVTDAAVGTAGVTIAGNTYSFAGAVPTSTVSVGSKGYERTITNVAPGRLSADSTDAVNGSQLFATNSAIDTINNNINVLDKGSVKYDVNQDGTVNYNHITLAGGDAGTTISNVAAGEKGTDAVNVDQLNNAVAESKTHYYSVNDNGVQGGNYKNDGATGNNSLAAGVNAKASAESGVALGSDSVAKVEAGVKGYTPASASADQVDAIAATTSTRGSVSVGDADNGIYRQINGVAAGSADSDAVNVAQLKGAIGSATANAVSYDNSTHNSVTLNGDTYNSETKQGGTKITNVAAGVNDSDAVNMAQLNQTNTTVNNVTEGKDGMFQVNNTKNLPKPKPTGKDSTAGGAGAVASADNSTAIGSNARATHSNSVAIGANASTDRANSVSVGSAGAERQITHVAAGTADTDAVNLAQLNKATGDINNTINNVYSDLKHDLNKQDDTLSAGIAGALAAATLPQPYAPGASMASFGAGNYRGQQALALGVSRISDNGKWVTKFSGNVDSQGNAGVSLGVGYQW
ncbi:YadA-like family protein [Pseudomonas sp. LA21]|uniref:YadA-like family protein n=1 Tax=Pseudomonas sp. LA21 TaxID=2893373 RepID=UPI001FB77631|nr:YadA-like family protein [Pseudomonas sp. LA21]